MDSKLFFKRFVMRRSSSPVLCMQQAAIQRRKLSKSLGCASSQRCYFASSTTFFSSLIAVQTWEEPAMLKTAQKRTKTCVNLLDAGMCCFLVEELRYFCSRTLEKRWKNWDLKQQKKSIETKCWNLHSKRCVSGMESWVRAAIFLTCNWTIYTSRKMWCADWLCYAASSAAWIRALFQASSGGDEWMERRERRWNWMRRKKYCWSFTWVLILFFLYNSNFSASTRLWLYTARNGMKRELKADPARPLHFVPRVVLARELMVENIFM